MYGYLSKTKQSLALKLMAIYTLKSNILVYFSHLNYLLILSYVDDDGRYGEYFDPLGRAPTRVFERYMN